MRDTFVAIASEHGGMPREQAEAFVEELEMSEKRYRPDVWAQGMDLLAFIFMVAALVMFVFAAGRRELRHFTRSRSVSSS